MKESLLVNTLGHSAGVVLFGLFLYLLDQDRAARRLSGSRKSILAAALALAWNLASLIVLGTADSSGLLSNLVATAGFSVLSLLPAVLFDLSLSDRLRNLVHAGYVLAAAAITLHIIELAFPSDSFHAWGLILITVGFGTFTGIAAVRFIWNRDGSTGASTSRLVGTMLLFLLSISFVHFGTGHATQLWSRELAFHHALIPLALLILLQDYRFVLADAFVRFVANVALAALFAVLFIEAGGLAIWNNGAYGKALELVAACLSLIVFAILRSRLQRLLTRLVFRKPAIEAELRALKLPVEDEVEYLLSAVDCFKRALGADANLSSDKDLRELDPHSPMLASELPRQHSGLSKRLEEQGIEVILPLRSSSGEARFLLLGRRSGGRPYLSEDLKAMQQAAGFVIERLERLRESETRRLVAQAELRALQSQIHPHFLFNALNTLYGIIPREAKGARETVLNLADIFRYFLETRKSFLPLGEELRIVKAYLAVEALRLGGKLNVEIDVDPDALDVQIPLLSLEPLVENAVKHGISAKAGGGMVRVEARMDAAAGLRIVVKDTGVGFGAAIDKPGVGLENVRRRLELCYGPSATLEIHSSEQGSTVTFTIPASRNVSRGAALEVGR